MAMRLEIQCEDRIGMIREVLDLFTPYQIDVRLIEVDTLRRCIYCGFSDIAFSKIQKLLAEIRKLDDVEDVKTVAFTPSERETNTLYMLLEALPDGVISVDLKGVITMATELAAEDLQTSVAGLLHQPLQQFIKGVNFAKIPWQSMPTGLSKRIKIRSKTLLLEMKPIWVQGDDGSQTPAGSVIHLKSEARLQRQTQSLKNAPKPINGLDKYHRESVLQSSTMAGLVSQAKSLADLTMPLLFVGQVGTGKRDFIQALFQFWYDNQLERDCQIVMKSAEDIDLEDIQALDSFCGWWVIEHIERLKEEAQFALLSWLAKQTDELTSLRSSARLVSLSSLTQEQLIDHATLNKSLYFELSTLVLTMPELARRREDFAGLLEQTLEDICGRYNLALPSISKGALAKLSLYPWPGNLKELHSVCLQTLLANPNKEWQAEDLGLASDNTSLEVVLQEGSLDKTVKAFEAKLLRQLYPQYPSTRRLAKAVGLSHSAVANKLNEYNIALK